MGELGRVNRREVINKTKLTVTLADKNEGWYGDLVGDTVYDKFLNLQRKHL